MGGVKRKYLHILFVDIQNDDNSEIEIVKKSSQDCPILLLDDVLSELDRNRQNYLLDSIHDIQTIITCTGLEEFIDSRLTLDRVFRVKEGTVTLETR